MRRDAKVDANQPAIVAALRDTGATVQHLHFVGRGCPDVCVGIDGVNYLFEIKVPGHYKAEDKLTDAERKWHEEWKGQVAIIQTADDALEVMGK